MAFRTTRSQIVAETAIASLGALPIWNDCDLISVLALPVRTTVKKTTAIDFHVRGMRF